MVTDHCYDRSWLERHHTAAVNPSHQAQVRLEPRTMEPEHTAASYPSREIPCGETSPFSSPGEGQKGFLFTVVVRPSAPCSMPGSGGPTVTSVRLERFFGFGSFFPYPSAVLGCRLRCFLHSASPPLPRLPRLSSNPFMFPVCI